MNTRVSILHRAYPERVRAVVEERLQGLSRFYDRIVTVSARLERNPGEHHVELVANVGRQVLVADVRGRGFRSALDEALNRLASQLRKHHDKVRLERRRPR